MLRWILTCIIGLILTLSAPLSAEPASTPSGTNPDTALLPSDVPQIPDGLRLPPPPSGFKRHDGGFIEYAYSPDTRQRISKMIEVADSVRDELSDKLGTAVLHNVHVRIARTPVEMSTFAPENAPYPKYAAGVAYPALGLILLTLEPERPNPDYDIVETFKHELAHLALHDAVKGRNVPRWFNEGFAVFVSGESALPRLRTLWVATVAGKLLPLERLDRSFPDDAETASIAYAQAVDVVRYLVRRQDRYRFDALVEQLAQGQDFGQALTASYGIDQRRLEGEWREDVGRRYTVWPVLTSSTLLWGGIVMLFFVGYGRRKAKTRATLARWQKEDDREDARNAARRIIFEEALAEAAQTVEKRVHIVMSSPELRLASRTQPPTSAEREVPKVVHDGSLHTLH